MKKTKKAYQEYLNSMDATFSHDDRIIGGKFRWGMYGDELRKYTLLRSRSDTTNGNGIINHKTYGNER